MKILFAGTPANAAQTLVELHRNGIEIVGAITRPDAPIGRKKVLTPSPVAFAAESLGIPVIKANAVTAEVIDQIKELGAELGVVVAYGSFLSSQALAALDRGWLNLHYSLLPKYRGAAPVQWALINGETETGVSVFQLTEGMDAGDVYIQVPTVIEPGENAERLLTRLTQLGVTALLECLPQIFSGLAKPQPQNHSLATFAPKISRLDAKLDWQKPAHELEHLVNAMNPEPVAWADYLNEPIRVLEARTIDAQAVQTKLPNGQVVVVDKKVLVGATDNTVLELLTVQPAGKTAMSALAWANGLPKDSVHSLG